MHGDRNFPNPNPPYILREGFEAREYRAMRIGVPREIKTHEYRVGLTPAAVREYVAARHKVLVESNAGEGIGASDDTYRKAGADIADSARDVFAASEMIVKVKEPQPAEWAQLREGQLL